MSDMGDRIRYYRERAGLTQEELGERLGIKKSAVAKYENGRVENIKRSSVKILAEVLGVSPCVLLFGEEEEMHSPAPGQVSKAVALTADERELIRLYRDLTEKSQEQVFEMVRMIHGNAEARKGGKSGKTGTSIA